MIRHGTQIYYYHTNSLRPVSEITNSSGAVVEHYQYDAYGKPSIFDANWNPRNYSFIDNRFMFTGREYDYETGFYYYRARYYDPTTGRFLSRDPKGYVDGMCLYGSFGNNPINRLDPFGTQEKEGPTAPKPDELKEKPEEKKFHKETVAYLEKHKKQMPVPVGDILKAALQYGEFVEITPFTVKVGDKTITVKIRVKVVVVPIVDTGQLERGETITPATVEPKDPPKGEKNTFVGEVTFTVKVVRTDRQRIDAGVAYHEFLHAQKWLEAYIKQVKEAGKFLLGKDEPDESYWGTEEEREEKIKNWQKEFLEKCEEAERPKEPTTKPEQGTEPEKKPPSEKPAPETKEK
jgi:RHS repeat-associated protein